MRQMMFDYFCFYMRQLKFNCFFFGRGGLSIHRTIEHQFFVILPLVLRTISGSVCRVSGTDRWWPEAPKAPGWRRWWWKKRRIAERLSTGPHASSSWSSWFCPKKLDTRTPRERRTHFVSKNLRATHLRPHVYGDGGAESTRKTDLFSFL